MITTVGLSPKAVLAFFFPFISTLIGVAIVWVNDGTFDSNAIRVGVAGLLASALALLGGYVGKPGNVINTADGPADNWHPGDQAPGEAGYSGVELFFIMLAALVAIIIVVYVLKHLA